MFRVDNELIGPNVPRTVRFTESIVARLTEVSKENKISFNQLVLQCCKYALDSMDEEKKPL